MRSCIADENGWKREKHMLPTKAFPFILIYISWMHFYRDFLIFPFPSWLPVPHRTAPHRTQTLFIQWAYNFRFQLHFHSLFHFTFCAESKVPLRQLNAVDFLNFSFSFYARLSFGCSCVRSKEFQITKCFCSWNLLPALMWCFVKTKPFPYTVDPLYDKWFVADEKGWSHKVNMFFASQIDGNWLKSKMLSNRTKLVRRKSNGKSWQGVLFNDSINCSKFVPF